MTEEEVYNYRKDNRTDEEMKENIEKYTLLEEKYLWQFIEIHNRRRKKRSLTVEHWGNIDNKIYKNLEAVQLLSRPDFILNTCYDNSYLIKDKQPIEVQCCKIFLRDYGYIKTSKVDWAFDKFTEKICNKKTIILFVLGTGYPSNEKYSLFRPRFLDKIKKNGIWHPICYGKKPSYRFSIDDVRWKNFNHFSAQQTLEKNGENNGNN